MSVGWHWNVTMLCRIYCIILHFQFCFALNLTLAGDILVKDKYIPCSEVDFNNQRLVCEIRSEDDETKIERFGLSGCYGSTLSCAEGDIKTCMPLMTLNTLHYQCYCRMSEDTAPLVSDYYWSGWQNLTKRFRRFIYYRQLLINNGTDYVAEEYSRISTGVQYIVANNSLPDSVFTASSYYSNSHVPKRARIDNYFTYSCAWAANSGSDSARYLQISLPGQYEVIGIYIRQRCDYAQYPTVVNVTTSVDDVLWQDVLIEEDIATRYSSYDLQGSVSVWFPRSYTTRYWKIYIVKHRGHPSMKCDLIGYAISNTLDHP